MDYPRVQMVDLVSKVPTWSRGVQKGSNRSKCLCVRSLGAVANHQADTTLTSETAAVWTNTDVLAIRCEDRQTSDEELPQIPQLNNQHTHQSRF